MTTNYIDMSQTYDIITVDIHVSNSIMQLILEEKKCNIGSGIFDFL